MKAVRLTPSEVSLPKVPSSLKEKAGKRNKNWFRLSHTSGKRRGQIGRETQSGASL